MNLLGLGLAFSGFVALCLAMEKHQLELYGAQRAAPARMRQLRSAGWLLLAAAFACCVTALGWSIGPVLWLGTLSASAALLTYGLLPYRPRAIVPLALAAPPLGLAAALLC
ncbi:DUF3325 domain-containing protein [Xanthomonas graminis]|uniref:Putative membrane protein n=1 Tax=Xanthomonas graminis pv. phlei TaxID=487906 RepID=A0A0K2ZKV5_9XANT|nr:DUF3325 domain-containing protein [Xanthomonas translucens]UKE67407.1 DUF3325 domain-containing protein [Xanthomonas translucens pv. phlei]UKE75113.1 DUF3325 domain-containing protein [Xanthomonas translucens pv. phleipratensis]CTP86268.1 putative membrane protein [Xanthomonas translucens pv. phlei]